MSSSLAPPAAQAPTRRGDGIGLRLLGLAAVLAAPPLVATGWAVSHLLAADTSAAQRVSIDGVVAYVGVGLALALALAWRLGSRLAASLRALAQRHQVDADSLRASEERLSRALDASNLTLWDYDVARGEVWLSSSWSGLVGAPGGPSRVPAAALLAQVPADERPVVLAALDAALKDPAHGGYRVEHRVCRHDGTSFVNLSEGRVVERDAAGRARRIVGTNRDITDRKAAEAALGASERTLRSILDSALDAVVLMGADGRIAGWNRQAEQTFGWRADEAIGRPLHDLIVPPQHRQAHQRGMRHYLATGVGPALNRRLELTALRRDGREFPVELTVTPIHNQAGPQFSAFVRDLSDVRAAAAAREALEAQLRESQKMEAIGTLAGGIAHDFNNILGAILGHAQLARADLPAAHPAQASLEQVHKAGLRARGLVQQILAFSRRQEQCLLVRPLRPLVDDALSLLRATLPAGVALQARLADAPLKVLADATQIQQVLMNLCTNAWHALPETGGRISVALDAVEHGPEPGVAGPCARLSVSDDGRGMDAATRARIFEPFFTTKPVGQGTGLGLAVVHGIVAAHQGAIRVDSAPGQGSRFELYLPLASGGVEAPDSELGGLEAAQGSGERVLYVDDDEVMSAMADALLRRAGFRVTCCPDPREALAALAADVQRFDVVVTDHNMPGMSGLELARAVARLRAGLPVIVGSGCITEAMRADAPQAGVRFLMHKENAFSDLAALVQRALADAAA